MIAEQRCMTHAVASSTLADVLERVLDKGVVIAGDIKIQIADIDLITIKIRLLIASVDKAKEMGIDWWEHDSYLTSKAEEQKLEEENRRLREQLAGVEANTSTEPAEQTPCQHGCPADPAGGPSGGGQPPRHDPTGSLGASRSADARPPGPRTPPATHRKDAHGPCAGAVGKAGPRGDS